MKRYVYEPGKTKDGERVQVRREAKEVVCSNCKKTWLIRLSRKSPEFCKSCMFIGEKNPRWGKEPHNKGSNLYDHKEYAKSYYKTKRQENRKKAIALLGNQCSMCGHKNLPLCTYDIHHKNPKDKSENISVLLAYGWNMVEEEIKKCTLLCVMCHRVLHHGNERLE